MPKKIKLKLSDLNVSSFQTCQQIDVKGGDITNPLCNSEIGCLTKNDFCPSGDWCPPPKPK